MENFDEAMELAGVSTNSAGTALDKYANSYLPSVESATNRFNAAFEKFSTNFLDSDLVAGVIDLGTGLMSILSVLAQITSIGDGVVVQLGAITTALILLNSAINAYNAGTLLSTGEPNEASIYHAREYSDGDIERVNNIIVLLTREYLEKPTILGLIA